MLFEDITHGALFHGFLVDIDGLDSDALRELETFVRSCAPFRLWMPGDTIYGDPAGQAIIGVPVAIAASYDGPTQVTLDGIAKTREQFESASKKHMAKLSKKYEAIAAADKTAETYLTCCGPLCYATLSYGELWPSDKSKEAEYTFHSFQDMDQEWTEEGVDGITLGSVEWSDLDKIQLDADRLERLADKVAKKQNPGLWICVRYD